MEATLSLVYFLIFCIILAKLPFFQHISGISLRMLIFFFALKVLAGFIMVAIYTHIYELEIADFHKYFSDGMILYNALWKNPMDYLMMLTGINANAEHLSIYYDQMGYWFRPWESPVYNDNRVVIRFNALVGLFSFGRLGVHTVFINFLSLSGLVAMYKFVLKYADQEKLFWLPWGFFLFPSLVFWGSGILKEGILIWAFGFWVLFTDRLITRERFSIRTTVVLLFFSFILLLLKPYTLIFWLPGMIAFYWAKKGAVGIQFIKYMGVLLGFVFAALVIGYLFPAYNFLELIARKQNDFVNLAMGIDAGSIIHTRYLRADLLSVGFEFFAGLFYALFRPHPAEAYSILVWVAALENLFVWILFLFAMFFIDRKSFQNYPILFLSIWFAVLLMGFVGMITPVHGGIVRYKIPALPFLWVFWVHITRLPLFQPANNPQ